MSAPILKPIFLVPALGEYAVMPDGAIINIGGVQGPAFTVSGKPLLFADGTTTDGSAAPGSFLVDMQTAYTNSVGSAFIDFTHGKNFILSAVNHNQFIFNADTGLVTIMGDLVVQGSTTTVSHQDVDSSRVAIHAIDGNYTPFIMEPKPGVAPTVNVVDIKTLNGGASVFTIDPAGVTNVATLNVGLINGIDIAALKAKVDSHEDLTSGAIKHTAVQVSVDDRHLGSIAPVANVQEALNNISTAITTLSSEVGVKGYEHIQTNPQTTWTVVHGQNTRRVTLTVWDSTDEAVFPDTITITDANTLVITYNTPLSGRAILMLF